MAENATLYPQACGIHWLGVPVIIFLSDGVFLWHSRLRFSLAGTCKTVVSYSFTHMKLLQGILIAMLWVLSISEGISGKGCLDPLCSWGRNCSLHIAKPRARNHLAASQPKCELAAPLQGTWGESRCSAAHQLPSNGQHFKLMW